MQRIMENIIEDVNLKKKSLNWKTLMVVAFKQRSGDLSFIQIHLLEVKPLPSHKAGRDENQALGDDSPLTYR